jgi:hypothetical protein
MESRRGSIASPRDQAVTMEIYANASSAARRDALRRLGDGRRNREQMGSCVGVRVLGLAT